jgi:hypothetical protein
MLSELAGAERAGSRGSLVHQFTICVYFDSTPVTIRVPTATRGGGETMGPVHFNKTKVKQEDRRGKRRK